MDDRTIKSHVNRIIEYIAADLMALEDADPYIDPANVAEMASCYRSYTDKEWAEWMNEVGVGVACDKIIALFPKGIRL